MGSSEHVDELMAEMFPDYRPETEEDRDLVAAYREAIRCACRDALGSDRARLHSVKASAHTYHLTTEEHGECIVALEDGVCHVDRVIPPSGATMRDKNPSG